MIKSRFLRHMAEFQKPVRTKDSAGEIVETWERVATRYVDVRPVGIESTTEQGVNYEVSRLELQARYSRFMQDEIKTGYRVIINEKAYQIDELGDVFTRKKLTYFISSYE